MRNWIIALSLMATISCAVPNSFNYYKEYAFNDGVIALGMTTQEVRQAIGTPDKIELPEAIITPFSPSGVQGQAIKNQQFWVYENCSSTKKADLIVMFKGTTVVKIYTVEKS